MKFNNNASKIKPAHQKGFTLLEVVIVMVVIAILSAIAFPSYQDSVRKARRGDAQEALLECASAQARYFTRTAPSSYMQQADAIADDVCGSTGAGNPLVSQEGFYTLTITNNSCTQEVAGNDTFWCFSVRANPQGPQTKDTDCLSLTIDERGNRSASVNTDGTGTDTTDICWRS